MKSKTSITLSADVLEAVDKIANGNRTRSEIIERAVREYIQRMADAKRDQRDLEILNRSAKRMARESKDALKYQVKL